MVLDLEGIRALCVEVGNCWIWQQGTTSSGQPLIRWGTTSVTVRRKVFELDRGRPAHPGWFVVSKCVDKMCVAPGCAVDLSGADYRRHLNRIGALNGPAHNAAKTIAVRRRSMTKLDAEKVADIKRRVAAGEDRGAVSSIYGISRHWCNRIARGEGWQTGLPGSSVFNQRA